MNMLRYLFLLGGLICLFFLRPSEIWAEGPGSAQESVEKPGTLQLFLAIKKNLVNLQEDVECTVLLKNNGASSLTMKLPALDRSMPIARVRSVSTDVVRQYQRQPDSSPQIPSDLTLAAGAVLKNSFSLRDIVPLLRPDEYQITVFWRYDNENRTAESNSVGLVVLPD